MKTGLPVPDIRNFNITDLNEIDPLYIAMGFLEETQGSEKWFSLSASFSELAHLRHRMDTVAEAMSKLRNLEFDKIGSIHFSSDMTWTIFISGHATTGILDWVNVDAFSI